MSWLNLLRIVEVSVVSKKDIGALKAACTRTWWSPIAVFGVMTMSTCLSIDQPSTVQMFLEHLRNHGHERGHGQHTDRSINANENANGWSRRRSAYFQP
jgi:hypothetical protein